MAVAKRKTAVALEPAQGRALRNLPVPRAVAYRAADSKHMGEEPDWPSVEDQSNWTHSDRQSRLITAFNWYNYTHDPKDAKGWVIEFFSHMPRHEKTLKELRRLGDSDFPRTYGWLARMGRRGLVLKHSELRRLLKTVKDTIAKNAPEVPVESKETKGYVNVINIQDRLNEKMSECLGEIEGAYDEFWTGDFKTKPGVMTILQTMSPPANRVKEMIAFCERHIAEYNSAMEGKDPQLVEGYSRFGKRQLKAMAGWWQQAIIDLNSYGNIKKTERKPRAKKAVPPERIVSKIKYCKKFDELKLVSIHPVDILRSSEVWVYNVKKRKLGVYQADTMVQVLGVKSTTIVGFDPVVSVQKTLRKPAEQLKALMAAGKPASKKLFKEIKSTDVKLNGRLGEDWIILKAYK